MERVRERFRYVDDLVCNRLEYRAGKATGKLLDPVIGGFEGGRWLQQYAREHEIDRLLQEWLLERPGAEAGDCSGRPIDVKSRFA